MIAAAIQLDHSFNKYTVRAIELVLYLVSQNVQLNGQDSYVSYSVRSCLAR